MASIIVDEELAARIIRDSREFDRLVSAAVNVSDTSAGKTDSFVLDVSVKVALKKYAEYLEERIAHLKNDDVQK